MSQSKVVLEDLSIGKRLLGVVTGSTVSVVAVEQHGANTVTLTYRTDGGQLGELLVTPEALDTITEAPARRWTFDADGAMFRLASEARRMKWAHLADPFAAIDTSNIEPYPHQIDAVYNELLTLKPLRFLLADDPGAGKTIMSGLLIRELMLRGDVARCLIVAPGSLVDQWHDELWQRFGLDFEVMSRAAMEASHTGNPFLDKNLLVARLDQTVRNPSMIAKLRVTDWDLVIVDEAHKMSAHRYGKKLNKTKRFQLGEILRDITRHFLLLTATPHNGKDDDFLAFMTLLDPDRFAGRLRGTDMPDTSDLMRRLVKENLRTFEGKRLFPKRYAHTLGFDFSPPERDLYEAVTQYVRHGMNQADYLQESGDKQRGLVIGFALMTLQRRLASSPAAIASSLRRRRDRLRDQAANLLDFTIGFELATEGQLPKGITLKNLEEFDYDDYDNTELDQLENYTIDTAAVAATVAELDYEISELNELVRQADHVLLSRKDAKWVALRELLRSGELQHYPEGSLANPVSTHNAEPRKLIVFSEHKDTVEYLAERIREERGRHESVVVIHGDVNPGERRHIQDQFRVDPAVEVLVATDAAGEGVNLQAASLMVNYDLPWNPNRMEQRFGRIHRIGQQRPCRLWNLVAHETREGQVFHRLLEKIEQQRGTYGDQIYDVLGDSLINTSLRDLLIESIREDSDPVHTRYMDEIIDNNIGDQLDLVMQKRALVGGLSDSPVTQEIRDEMERSRAQKLQPWFVEAFFTKALTLYGGRIARRSHGQFEITRVPAVLRSNSSSYQQQIHELYHRVTFSKDHTELPDSARADSAGTGGGRADGGRAGGARADSGRAELISPGTALLGAVVHKVLADHGTTLDRGAMLIDPDDRSTEVRLLVYLTHTITDGRVAHGRRQVVSRRFQYVEINQHGEVRDAGSEPYLGYEPIDDNQRSALLGAFDLTWADYKAESAARDWAIEHLARPHLEQLEKVTRARVSRVEEAVEQRLKSEIYYWDGRAEEAREAERRCGVPARRFAHFSKRADDLHERLKDRRAELAAEKSLHSSPPNLAGAAIVVPQGLLDDLDGMPPDPDEEADRQETDRRAVAAVIKAEKALGRDPEEQEHNNPGYDVLSVDPDTNAHYFIEVKGHLPQTKEISVSVAQVQKARSNPGRWLLAVVSVPRDTEAEPEVRYLMDPFRETTVHFAQTRLTLNVKKLLAKAVTPTRQASPTR